MGGADEKQAKGLRDTNGQLQNRPGDVECSMGKMVNNVVINMSGGNGVLGLVRWSLYELCGYLTIMLYN